MNHLWRPWIFHKYKQSFKNSLGGFNSKKDSTTDIKMSWKMFILSFEKNWNSNMPYQNAGDNAKIDFSIFVGDI